jgi:hypothetical protein
LSNGPETPSLGRSFEPNTRARLAEKQCSGKCRGLLFDALGPIRPKPLKLLGHAGIGEGAADVPRDRSTLERKSDNAIEAPYS